MLVKFPSNESIPTNIVTTTPKIHVIPDFKNLESLVICIFSERLETIEIAVLIYVIGRITYVIIFPINTIEKIINGSIRVVDATLPRRYH